MYSIEETFLKIRQWGCQKGLNDSDKQFMKLAEEVGELSKALLTNDRQNLKEELGDCIVVLTILALQNGLAIETCIKEAYNKIEKRKGCTVDGVFIKQNENT